MNLFFKDYDLIFVKFVKIDDIEVGNDRRKYNYEKCYIKVLEEYE